MTVTVTVKVYAYVPAYKGPREFTAQLPEDAAEAVDQLLAGPCSKLKKDLGSVNHLLVNGRNYHLAVADKTKLKDGDILSFVSMFCGG